MEETPLFWELYIKDLDSTSLEFYFLNYVLKTDEKTHKSDCNEVTKPQKELKSASLLSTIYSVSQISSDTA